MQMWRNTRGSRSQLSGSAFVGCPEDSQPSRMNKAWVPRSAMLSKASLKLQTWLSQSKVWQAWNALNGDNMDTDGYIW